MNRFMKMTGQALLDLFYPLRCPVCQKLPARGLFVCPECRQSLPLIAGPRCVKCGKPVRKNGECCDDCRTAGHSYDSGVGLYLYNDVMKTILSALKYKGRRVYGIQIGQLLGEEGEVYITRWRVTAVVPVPVHRKRLKKRGYNQAEELAKTAAAYWNLPLIKEAVVRRGETTAMKVLGRTERRENLKGAFAEGRDKVAGERILVIDDIYTTGATMDAMADVLKGAGALSVHFLSVCIGGGFVVEY